MFIQIDDVGHAIQLAIAPVFLLAGLGTLLVVLTNRLARIIDRTRFVEQRLRDSAEAECLAELKTLYLRTHMITAAIWMCTVSGLLVCIVIAMLFVDSTTTLPLDGHIAGCFVLTMIALMGGFACFLREISIAFRYMRVQQRKSLST